jgi:hypothetical protein
MAAPPTTRTGRGVIRPLERADLDHVAALYELVARSGGSTPPPGLATHFAETLLDHPWADASVPSLVYDDGRVTGFIGSHVRRFTLDGRPLRFAYGGQLITHPAARKNAVGFFLLRAFMEGPQDVTLTDTAGEATLRMWTRLGGRAAALPSLSWFRIFRPLSFAIDHKLAARGRGGLARAAGRATAPLDRIGARRLAPAEPPESLQAEPLRPETMIEGLSRRAPTLAPAYDLPFLRWLLPTVADVRSRGKLVATLLRADGLAAGWYLYYLRPGGLSDVLQVAALPGSVGAVVDHLFTHAHREGAALLRGRIEPHLLEPLGRRRCLFRYNGGALVHTHDAEIAATMASPDSLLTRLEGDWWMGHHLEPFA